MSTQLTIEEAVQEAFTFLDPGRTGFIDNKNVQKLLGILEMDVSEDEVSKFAVEFNNMCVTNHLASLNLDLNQSEKSEFYDSISASPGLMFQSFSEILLTPMSGLDGEQWAKEEFKLFDKEGKGFISEADVTRHMTSLGAKIENFNVVKMMKNFDGVITLPMFIQIFNELNKKIGTQEPARQPHEN